MKINDLSLNNNANEISCVGTVVLPYHHGTTEEFQCIVHKTTNTFRNPMIQIKEEISFTLHKTASTNCIDCDVLYIRKYSLEILTPAKKHLS